MIRQVWFALAVCGMALAAPAATEPQWLKQARAREAKLPAARELKSKDGWFKARVPAKVIGSIEKVDGSYSVELAVGEDQSTRVYCEVYPEGIDLADALRVTLGNSMQEVEANQGKIEARSLEAMDAGAYGPVPYIAATWMYRVAASDGARVGALKQFVMEKGELGVYCAHNDLGFTRTFATLTQAFAASLQADAAAVPYYTEISTATLSNVRVGVAIATLELDREGDTKARQTTAMLLSGGNSLQSQDSTHIEWLRPDATIINAVHTDASNGELQSSLSLKADDGPWVVAGEMQGKAVTITLPKEAQPASWVAQARELRTLLALPNAVGREHSTGMWLSANPHQLTVVKTRILSKQSDKFFMARGELGPISANLTLEKATGMASAADVKMGPVSIQLERVYVSGSF